MPLQDLSEDQERAPSCNPAAGVAAGLPLVFVAHFQRLLQLALQYSQRAEGLPSSTAAVTAARQSSSMLRSSAKWRPLGWQPFSPSRQGRYDRCCAAWAPGAAAAAAECHKCADIAKVLLAAVNVLCSPSG